MLSEESECNIRILIESAVKAMHESFELSIRQGVLRPAGVHPQSVSGTCDVQASRYPFNRMIVSVGSMIFVH